MTFHNLGTPNRSLEIIMTTVVGQQVVRLLDWFMVISLNEMGLDESVMANNKDYKLLTNLRECP